MVYMVYEYISIHRLFASHFGVKCPSDIGREGSEAGYGISVLSPASDIDHIDRGQRDKSRTVNRPYDIDTPQSLQANHLAMSALYQPGGLSTKQRAKACIVHSGGSSTTGNPRSYNCLHKAASGCRTFRVQWLRESLNVAISEIMEFWEVSRLCIRRTCHPELAVEVFHSPTSPFPI